MNLHPEFEQELVALINRYSMENTSNTPDWILANYLMACLAAFDAGTQQRETWYGRDGRPTESIAGPDDGPQDIPEATP